MNRPTWLRTHASKPPRWDRKARKRHDAASRHMRRPAGLINDTPSPAPNHIPLEP
jgi:hypothetical protein